MLYYGLFIFEIILLFIFSRNIIQSFFFLILRLTKNQKLTVYLVAFLFFPGVVIHELSHFLTAVLLFVPVGHMNLWPNLTHEGLKLGSVQIAKVDIFRRFVVGVAPVIMGITFLIGIPFYITRSYGIDHLTVIKSVVILCAIFQIGNTMFSSKKDMEGSLILFIFIVLLSGALYLAGFSIPDSIMSFLVSKRITDYILLVNTFLVIPLTIDLIVFLIAKILLKIR